ncbi:helix-turn-helix transcriptional regulator [Streptomyces sp. NPDC059355]|uniref:helix-turn-helix transcriptional regulator n=1 Tax=Streptomyces sp. NPDC059355 TaxID=3346811 RepID=UPI0036CABE5E
MTRPMLTQREAAAACGVSRSTIRRRREAGDLPNSVQDAERGWMVPVDDLLAAGFRLNAPAPADPPAPAGAGPAAPAEGPDVAALRAELEDRIRAEHALALAHAEYGQKLAEAEAEHLRAQLAERGERIADLQRRSPP